MLSSLPAETALPQHKRRSIKSIKAPGSLESCLSSLASNPRAFFGPWSPTSSPGSTVPSEADQSESPGSWRAETVRKGKSFSPAIDKATRSYVDEEGRTTTPQKHKTHGGAVNDRRKVSLGGMSKGLLRLISHRTLSDVSLKVGPKSGKQDTPTAKVAVPGDRSEEEIESSEAPSTDSVTDERHQFPSGGRDEAEVHVVLPGDRSEECKEPSEAPSTDSVTGDERCQVSSDGGEALPGDLSEENEESSEAPSTDSERFQFPSHGGDDVARKARSPRTVVASKRVAAEEADVENCRSATIEPRAVTIDAPSTAVLATTAAAPDILTREAAAQGLVLPCAPSDEEKVRTLVRQRVLSTWQFDTVSRKS